MFALHRSWQRFEDLQKGWVARETELSEQVGQFKADALVANSLSEELKELKIELEAAKQAASNAAKEAKEATREAKEKKEELRTCRLDRDYHADLANTKASLVEGLEKEVASLKESKAELTDELEDAKDAIKVCFYMFWKHNRNADFSYLGEAYAADEAECLERLAEEEADAAAAAKDAAPQDPPNSQA